MRKYVVLMMVVAAMSCCMAVFASVPTELKVHELKLKNGMTVWLNEDHSQPKVFGAVVVKAGARNCPNTGIAHYFEHILFKGTDRIGTVDYKAEKPWLDSISACYDRLAQTRDAAQRTKLQNEINRLSIKAAEYAIPNDFDNLVAFYGGSGLNAYTAYDETVYHNTFVPQYLRQWAELNSERLISPVYRLFQGELETVYEEKNMYSDNMLGAAMEKALAAIFGGTPYEYPIVGSTEHLKNPQLSEMEKFYGKYYVAGNMGLILSGDIDADTIMPLLESTFGRIPKGNAPTEKPLDITEFKKGSKVDIKMPIPLVKLEMLVYRAPGETSRDNDALDLAMALLSNDGKTGMLDSLSSANKIMMVFAGRMAFKDAGVLTIGIMPNLPFGSKKKAEKLCLEQVERLKRGEFSDSLFNALKRETSRDLQFTLEDVSKRSALMINAFAYGEPSWADYLARKEAVADITKADVVRVANKYLTDNFLRLNKKFGTYPKEKLSQPGYEPVKPKNAGAESEFAKMLDSIPSEKVSPRLVDLDSDANRIELNPMARIYTTKNPINDIFTLDLIFHKGYIADPCLNALADYMEYAGTDSLPKQKFDIALQQLGATVSYNASYDSFEVSIMGYDKNLTPTLHLVNQLLTCAKPDSKRWGSFKSGYKMDEKMFDKESAEVANALVNKLAFGEKSEYINRYTYGELKKTDGESLLNLLHELLSTECDMVYCGTLDDSAVKQAVLANINVAAMSKQDTYTDRQPLPTEGNVVYVYPMSTRQNIVGTYSILPGEQDERVRACRRVWEEYFGGGMSSVMFQELREFRSFAYYANGKISGYAKMENQGKPVMHYTVMGTQADKTLEALAVLDSLLRDMPMRHRNLKAARMTLLNELNNSYPSFRNIGSWVADYRSRGYERNPSESLVKYVPEVTDSDVMEYYEKYVKNAPRAIFIVGKLNKKEMEALKKYGEIRIVKKSDIYRTK